ncbi:MAG TPA: hypothetical protein VIF62_05470, partial [Labilithrix sp.]
ALAGLFADDASIAAVDGVIDPFSFEARSRALAAVKKSVAESPGDLPPAPLLERELLVRLVDEELARVDEERRLPWSASALVRGVVETWRAPKSMEDAAARDRWLARRLGEVRKSLGAEELDVGRARELDDALDALERLVDSPGFTQATGELVKLRGALEANALRRGEPPKTTWAVVATRLRVHVGVATSPDALEASLVDHLAKLAPLARAARDAAGTELVTNGAASATLADGECADAVPGSRVRSMTPPPERIAACHLRHIAASARTDAQRAVALVALHDSMVVALWALDVARGTSTLADATAKRRLAAHGAVSAQARLERVALARPASAIGAGLAAALLLDGDLASRGRAWSAIGDVPLDLAERELGR